jgi:hypothetical protein
MDRLAMLVSSRSYRNDVGALFFSGLPAIGLGPFAMHGSIVETRSRRSKTKVHLRNRRIRETRYPDNAWANEQSVRIKT